MGGFKKNERSLLASALQSIQKKDIIVVAVTIESRGSDVLGSDLLGSNVGLISEKVVNVSIKSLTEQKRLYREKGLTDINPADFAHFLTGLEAEGSLTLA
jgi:hypothetical protein